MRAYIEIRGEEHVVNSVNWCKDKLIHITVDYSGVMLVIFQEHSPGLDNLDSFYKDEIVHADLATKLYWRDSDGTSRD